MTPLAQEILDNFDKITAKYLGHSDAIAPMRVDHISKTRKHIAKLEATVAHLEDELRDYKRDEQAGFEINTRRHSRPLDAQFNLARLKRMRGEDAAIENELFGGAL